MSALSRGDIKGSMKDRLRIIIGNIFDIPIEEINEEISPNNCEKWDSLNQLVLLTAIEEEFEVEFSYEEVLKIADFKSIIDILEDKQS